MSAHEPKWGALHALEQDLLSPEGERRGQRLLFIHTLSSMDLGSLTSRAPALPRWTDRYRSH